MIFATCDREMAFSFLKKLYPSKSSDLLKVASKDLLDLVEKDIVRITDPDCHTGEVIHGTNFKENMMDDVMAACEKLHSS